MDPLGIARGIPSQGGFWQKTLWISTETEQLRRGTLWPSQCPNIRTGRMGSTGRTGRRSVIVAAIDDNHIKRVSPSDRRDILNKTRVESARIGQKTGTMGRHNLQPVTHQGYQGRRSHHMGLLTTFPPEGFGASESNQSIVTHQEQVPRWQPQGGVLLGL